MRTGGPFPFLAAADEVSMHIELHMRRCGAARMWPAESLEAAQELPATKQQDCEWKTEQQYESRRSQESAVHCSWQESFQGGLQAYSSPCSTTTSSGQCQPWAYGTQDCHQQTGTREPRAHDRANPWHSDGTSFCETIHHQPRYPRKLPQPLVQPEGHAVWERTAASCSSSSESSSESCHGSGNAQSPVGSQAFLHDRSKHPPDSGPRVADYSF